MRIALREEWTWRIDITWTAPLPRKRLSELILGASELLGRLIRDVGYKQVLPGQRRGRLLREISNAVASSCPGTYYRFRFVLFGVFGGSE